MKPAHKSNAIPAFCLELAPSDPVANWVETIHVLEKVLLVAELQPEGFALPAVTAQKPYREARVRIAGYEGTTLVACCDYEELKSHQAYSRWKSKSAGLTIVPRKSTQLTHPVTVCQIMVMHRVTGPLFAYPSIVEAAKRISSDLILAFGRPADQA